MRLTQCLLAVGFTAGTTLGIYAQRVDAPHAYPAPANENAKKWFDDGQKAVQDADRVRRVRHRAKNVILFIGDGMNIATSTAARILEGQMRGESGEENRLTWETFPHVCLSKTYNTNSQTPDSAGTMTAIVTGVKTKLGVLGVTQAATRGDWTTQDGNEVKSVLRLAEERGYATGVVATARITHATPAACYANSVDRNWEADTNLPGGQPASYKDIALQLVEYPYGNGLEVAFGGGRRNFLPNTVVDTEGDRGRRGDGRDLTREWTTKYPNSVYVHNQTGFDAINTETTEHALGLFESSHMEYEHDRPTDAGGEPSLEAMTRKAIRILNNNSKGFFLMVESGRIDHAHHATNAYRSLTDTIEFSDAVRAALDETDPRETLIIVTADHGHVFNIAGYPFRGNNIMGKVAGNDLGGTSGDDGVLSRKFSTGIDGLPYTTLNYGNGPGYTPNFAGNGNRTDLTDVNTGDADYLQAAAVPLSSETHSGEDVAIYATGCHAYLFHGVQEQNYIAHVIMRAMQFRPERP